MNNSITFIIAAYNDEQDVVKTLESIKAVMLVQDQLIVVDGASSDATVKNAKLVLGEAKNFILISEPDEGIYDAWNKAIEKATGEWIAFIGCGDLLRNNYRSEMTKTLLAGHDVNFVHFKVDFFSSKNGVRTKSFEFGRPLQKSEFRKRMRICHMGALHRRSLFVDREFSTRYKCVGDYHFLLSQLCSFDLRTLESWFFVFLLPFDFFYLILWAFKRACRL